MALDPQWTVLWVVVEGQVSQAPLFAQLEISLDMGLAFIVDRPQPMGAGCQLERKGFRRL